MGGGCSNELKELNENGQTSCKLSSAVFKRGVGKAVYLVCSCAFVVSTIP